MKVEAYVRGIRPEMALALLVAEQAFIEKRLMCRLTSATGGVHKRGLLWRTRRNAIDLGLRDALERDHNTLYSMIVNRLTDEWDVKLIGAPNPHIHIEFQPKTPLRKIHHAITKIAQSFRKEKREARC